MGLVSVTTCMHALPVILSSKIRIYTALCDMCIIIWTCMHCIGTCRCCCHLIYNISILTLLNLYTVSMASICFRIASSTIPAAYYSYPAFIAMMHIMHVYCMHICTLQLVLRSTNSVLLDMVYTLG